MSKTRVPMQVSPIFRDKVKEVQRKIFATGKEKSLRDITEEIINLGMFDEIEKKILNNNSIKMDIRLRFDKR